MTTRTPKLALLVAAAAGFCLLAGSAANAATSIAPFSLNVKSKIYTFNYPTGGLATFSCAACYAPGAVFSSSGTTGGGLYFYGPRFTEPRTVGNHPTPTSGYYFNPYWGAGMTGVTSSGGNAPNTPHTGNVATLLSAAAASGGPNFHVAPNQYGLHGITGSVSFGPGGNYLGTTSVFNATNAAFDLASGAGPAAGIGFKTYTGNGGKGKVRFTEGTDHANGFGGTIGWLGKGAGSFLIKSTAGGNANCAVGASLCYYYVPFQFPNDAGTGGGQNTWTDVVTYNFVNVFNGGATTSNTPSGTIRTRFTTHPETTGTVRMTQPFPSVTTDHLFSGSDGRTAMGLGNITLVTGWLGHTEFPTTTSDWGGTTVSKFNFTALPATPSLASPALGALGGLMAIAAVYVIRKRNSSN